jgi:DNA-directed RNA polymerase subunit H (RpoH/RPB5)
MSLGREECFQVLLRRIGPFCEETRWFYTLWEMLTDRGYSIQEFTLAQQTNDCNGQFILVGHRPVRELSLPTNRSTEVETTKVEKVEQERKESILFYYCELETAGKKTAVADIITGMTLLKCQDGIVVVRKGMTPDAKREFLKKVLCIDLFQLTDLIRNPTQSFVVPKHTCLSLKEAMEFLQKKFISLDKLHTLPKLFRHDPIAMYYGFPLRSIVRIDVNYGPPCFCIVVSSSGH